MQEHLLPEERPEVQAGKERKRKRKDLCALRFITCC
jgi:hypothetical protein